MVASAGAAQLDLGGDLERLAARASANRVAFYPISTSGRHSELSSAEFANAAQPGSSGMMFRTAMTAEKQSRDASLLRLAEETGGVAFTRTANFDALFDQVERDFRFYYSLGYRRDDPEDVDFRVVEVRVLREGARVRHAGGSRSDSWRTRLGAATHAAALFDRESNPLKIELTPGEETPSGKRFTIPIMVRIPWKEIRLIPKDGNYNARLTLLVVVQDLDDGGLSEPQRIDIPVRIPDQEILWTIAQPAAYPLQLEMKPGAKRVAVGVRDHLARVDATVSLDLEVGGGL